MRASVVAFCSTVLSCLVVWGAYNKKQQFYPTVVYLTSHQPCIAIIFFQCAVLLLFVAKLLIRLFFGRLQQTEVDNLVSQSWYAFFDTCLVFAFFQDELGTEFLFLFTILLLVKAFHWLIEERVDYMERTPVLTVLFHIRVLTLIFILAFLDLSNIRSIYWQPVVHGVSVHIALTIEYCVLFLSLCSTTVRYLMRVIDSAREHPWDRKAMYLLYADIIVGLLRLALYVHFTVAMWAIHPLPFFIARPIYLSVRALKKAIRDVRMSRRALRYMNTVFRDATAAELAASSDTVCIICREEMQVPTPEARGQQNQNSTLKRLPCSHIFHIGCLRSWFQLQQTCPTCRMDVIRQVRQQEQNQAAAAGAGQQPSGQPASSSAPTSTAATTSVGSQPNVDNAARPPWMPPGMQFPPFPAMWGPGFPTLTSASDTPSCPPMPAPYFMPPFMGMPIIYPGNLLPNLNTSMPEPPTGALDSASEARLRSSVEARFTALRQINVLLNAAVLQMNAYLNASTSVPGSIDGSQTPMASTSPEMVPVASVTDQSTTKPKLDEPSLSNGIDAPTCAESVDSGDSTVSEIRRRRVEHFTNKSTSPITQ